MEAGVQNASKYVTEFGFIVIQERTSASMTFYLTLSNYTEGFGDSQNFWIGLDVMNKLTSRYTWILRIEARVSGTGLFAIGEYYNFRVASGDQNYRFNIGNFNNFGCWFQVFLEAMVIEDLNNGHKDACSKQRQCTLVKMQWKSKIE